MGVFNMAELITFYFISASIPPRWLRHRDFSAPCVLLTGLSARIWKMCLHWMNNIQAVINVAMKEGNKIKRGKINRWEGFTLLRMCIYCIFFHCIKVPQDLMPYGCVSVEQILVWFRDQYSLDQTKWTVLLQLHCRHFNLLGHDTWHFPSLSASGLFPSIYVHFQFHFEM